MTKEHKGVIYILTNPSFKEYVKIGYAHDIEKHTQTCRRQASSVVLMETRVVTGR